MCRRQTITMYTRLDTMTVMGPLQSRRETRKQPPRQREKQDPTGSHPCRYHTKACQHGNTDGGVSRQRQRPHNDGAHKIRRPTQPPPPSNTLVVLTEVRASHTGTPLPKPSRCPRSLVATAPTPAQGRGARRHTTKHENQTSIRPISGAQSHAARERNRERKTEDKKQVRNDHPPSQRTLSTPARRPSTTAATGRQTRSPGWPPASRYDRQMRPTTRRHPTTPTRPPPSPGAEGPWAYPPSWMTRIQKREQRGGGHDAEGCWKKGKTAAGETS